MSELTWEEPPVPRGRGGSGVRNSQATNNKIAADLRAHPGQWAKLSTPRFASYPASIRKGFISSFRPEGHYEARWSGKQGGTGTVWVRYVGEGVED